MYHYEECGLSNVWLIDGFEIEHDEAYGELVSIASVNELHKTIGLYLINEKPELNGEEIRFLRKELNLSQKNLAGILQVDESTVRNWESDRGKITKSAELLLRALYKEQAHGGGALMEMIEKLNHQERTLESDSMSFSYHRNRSWKHKDLEVR
ncbi:helix-turn-helix domain-containing protein [Acinetobacter sp. MD2(2019)]|uniref:helix-turn-helix domain-containing protein n=1 Tax=Acinetobacter sp. MD2(2019) TaxID=2605273 RepID=UPI002D1F554A|nr:helix-turn-helix domain-containing protein [Acinetobacter sp. MD2(2019)]MEB3754894.1 helix-turn-helix domain-containing protein [Acinetobacter sp. MD2(2019)]